MSILRKNNGTPRPVLQGAIGLGFFMVGSIVGGYLVGSYLDSRFGTTPWLMLVLVFMGIASGFLEFYRVVKRIQEEEEKTRKP
ncbi:MAG TPA: AtpZ/AtpI family protein [Candidatus Hypogeohydataceae bacterium YC41]